MWVFVCVDTLERIRLWSSVYASITAVAPPSGLGRLLQQCSAQSALSSVSVACPLPGPARRLPASHGLVRSQLCDTIGEIVSARSMMYLAVFRPLVYVYFCRCTLLYN